MLEIENRPFFRDVSEPLLIARNLIRIYDQVLGQPLPAELLNLVARLENSAAPMSTTKRVKKTRPDLQD